MYMYTYIYTHTVCLYLYMYLYESVHIFVYVYIYIYIHICLYIYNKILSDIDTTIFFNYFSTSSFLVHFETLLFKDNDSKTLK